MKPLARVSRVPHASHSLPMRSGWHLRGQGEVGSVRFSIFYTGQRARESRFVKRWRRRTRRRHLMDVGNGLERTTL